MTTPFILILVLLFFFFVVEPVLKILVRVLITVITTISALVFSVVTGIGFISLALAAIVLIVLYLSGMNLGWMMAIALCLGLGAVFTLVRVLWHAISQKMHNCSHH